MTDRAAQPPMVEARDLRIQRGGRVVLELGSLDVGRGETWVLVGPNGAGKTSLLRALGLLDTPSAGTLKLFGEPLARPPPLALRRRVLTVFQETLLLDESALANVALPLKLRGIALETRCAAARAALALFEAEHLADRRARQLSGGEARRVALARGFAAKPELLLLDEPFAALDPPSRESLTIELKQAIHSTGTTCIAVTHDRTEALALSDHLGVILDGKLVQAGPTDAVFRAPADEAVARFIGVENLIPVRILERGQESFRLDASGIALTCPPAPVKGESAVACIRAQDVLLATGSPGPLSARNCVPCTVSAIVPAPAGLYVRLTGPFPMVALLTRAAVEDLGLTPQRPCTALFKSNAVHLLQA
ncbi:MAG TPA: ABC transporter ATP-binding protein [Myxococcales bacterium]